MLNFYVGFMRHGYWNGKVIDGHDSVYYRFAGEHPTKEELSELERRLLATPNSSEGGKRFKITILSLIRLAS